MSEKWKCWRETRNCLKCQNAKIERRNVGWRERDELNWNVFFTSMTYSTEVAAILSWVLHLFSVDCFAGDKWTEIELESINEKQKQKKSTPQPREALWSQIVQPCWIKGNRAHYLVSDEQERRQGFFAVMVLYHSITRVKGKLHSGMILSLCWQCKETYLRKVLKKSLCLLAWSRNKLT